MDRPDPRPTWYAAVLGDLAARGFETVQISTNVLDGTQTATFKRPGERAAVMITYAVPIPKPDDAG